MHAEPTLERETYVVVSTAHLAASTAAAMAELPIVCDESAYRFRVPLAPALDQAAALPAELAALLSRIAACAPDAYGVMIDRDGPLVPGLAVFDW
jgi:hypothetical protein